jgi:hypothetical protein
VKRTEKEGNKEEEEEGCREQYPNAWDFHVDVVAVLRLANIYWGTPRRNRTRTLCICLWETSALGENKDSSKKEDERGFYGLYRSRL